MALSCFHLRWSPKAPASCSDALSSAVASSPGACYGLQQPIAEGPTLASAQMHPERRKYTHSFRAVCPFWQAWPHSLPSPHPTKPVPACGSAPMLSCAPELGWVPIRQADITESHIQTWKQLIQWDSLSHLSPWDQGKAGLIGPCSWHAFSSQKGS